jgi:hypothetical protein
MAKSARRPAAPPSKRKTFRPALLAGGLGLLWFVQYQQGGPADEAGGPAWSHAVVLGSRLLADFVGAWVVIALLQLVFALIRATFAQLRSDRDREAM